MSGIYPGAAEWLSSLRQAIGILTPKDFGAIVDSELCLLVRMTLYLASENRRGLRGPSKYAGLLGELSNSCADVVAVQETNFICAADSRVLKNDCRFFSIREPL